MISVDLHLHTCHSYDCGTPLQEVVRSCRRSGLDCVAVTDHNTIAGALRLRESSDLRVIVGEEISTSDGELLGLFLTEPVPRGLSALKTIGLVKAQGGLACIPHPLGRKPFSPRNYMGGTQDGRYVPSPRVTRANHLLIEDVLAQVDLIEVINSRTPFAQTWAAVSQLAALSGLPSVAGSDAHTSGEIGCARMEMADFADAKSFVVSVRDARLSGVRSSVFVHFASMYAKLRG